MADAGREIPIRRSITAVLLLALVVAAAGCGGSGADEQASYRGFLIPGAPAAPALELHDQNGRTVTLAEKQGRWVLVTFLYTYCPDVCPVIAGNLNAALRTPAARRAGLEVFSVSVDPARDTPAAARQYIRQHRLLPGFVWLLGTRAELAKVWADWEIAVLPGAKRTITHMAPTLLIDPEGRERLVYDPQVKTTDIVHDLNLLVED